VICLLLSGIVTANDRQTEIPELAGLSYGNKPSEVSSSSAQTATREPLVLTYVANMGVLISSGNFKVLIDGLFDMSKSAWRIPSPEILESIMKGEAPFHDVDLILVTHKHQDHFTSALAVRYMESYPRPILLAPSDVVTEIRGAASDWPKIEARIIPIDLKVGENVKRKVADIPMTIIRTTHDNSTQPMNLMYLLEVNGWRVFHEGDASGKPDQFRGLGFETNPVDLAVVQYAWPLHPHLPWRRFFQDTLKMNHIALGHVNGTLLSTAESKIDKVRKYYKDIFVLLPGMPVKVFRK
jgi:L-ascorbate metabolism protein UlaG (beta-lactamase superfamily)